MGLQGDKCVSCPDLREEVKSIAMELKSAWEIIKILQEEVKCDNRSTTPRPNLETARTKVTEGCRGKKINHDNLISVPITSSNTFSPLEHQVHEEEENIICTNTGRPKNTWQLRKQRRS